MLDVKNSIERLSWTVEHHFLHIQAQHEFMRAWAIQFELAYTDFRVIQMALQLAGDSHHELLSQFSAAYEKVFDYEYAFVAGGLDGFNAKFGDQLDQYEAAEKETLGLIKQISAIDI
ncbi:hypothetical protein AYR62_05230 [Secundilactobacillus paracollinoides]|uniref:Glycosyl hydrolase family 92 domain-containing protein n=2 Tax=Secundilactobacillus paracollinoides TaxID=240427 RepID=A0A1B2J0K9_9LACO|nr:glycoside hydrolase domain-containing protein [Secundilactobacillus paracollinoides]ANZ61911.1 hypothetical protein AYR61_11490 [Secundilactobacillus paracollinoides]ANZ63552.1 hypothetical protein AYR62_05230 [Secundilactobacillus paracollinoides]ANZ67832.1 hypothetical protein AYR63_12250 [Secundilactobacillus paracollinoides]KRL75681.1 hypothetical protein FC17_GL002409 [Secundilactobacillus paracollinoides DSM 15502 = JCM 11969]